MFLAGSHVNKNCIKCDVITQKRCGVCPIETDIALCSIDCFSKHWEFHKGDTAILETFMIRFSDVLHDAQLLEIIDFRYYGSLREKDSDKKFIFLHDTDKDLRGSIQDHFKKQGLAGDEFANYYTTGKCGLGAYGFAGGLFLISKKHKILYRGNEVIEIGIMDIEVTKKYVSNVLVFNWPGKKNKGNHGIPTKSNGWQHHWDVDNIHSKIHQVSYVKLSNGEYYIIDFAASQYGVYSKFAEKYVHTESITDSKCSFGNIFQIRVMNEG